MTSIHLAFKAFDVHELLCHFLAEAAGLYANAELSVTLVDWTFIPDDELPANTFQAACGAALGAFLRGERRKVVYVACDRPMFWLYGRQGIHSLQQLDNARVATYADEAPPAHFLKALLANAGVSANTLPCRDDTARLGLLANGHADAALISSLYLPHEIESQGLNQLAFIGAAQRLPSSGLAVTEHLFKSEPELVATVTGVYRQAMAHVYADDDRVLRTVLVDVFNMSRSGLDQAIQAIRSCYNPAGFSEAGLLQSAVDRLAKGMGLEPPAATDLYDFKFI